MYWYYKYPLLLLVAVLTAWVAHWGWSRMPRVEAAAVRPSAAERLRTARLAARKTPSPTVAEARVRAPGPAAVPAVDAAAAELERKLKLAEENAAAGKLIMARGLAEDLLRAPGVKPFGPQWFRAADVVGRVNTALAATTAPAPEKVRCVVQAGDTLNALARKYQVTVEAIVRANSLDTANPAIHPGMVLSVLPAKWSVEVLKGRFVLLVRNGDRLFKYYRVGIGRENRTPAGGFKVSTRLREPEWSPPGRPPVPYGRPENILGTRWLGLQPAEGTDPTLKGFGIHGTWQPETVGTAASEGCVRMKNEDVNELFDLIPTGTRATIKDE